MKCKFRKAGLCVILAGVVSAGCAHQSEVATTMEMGTPGETVAGEEVLPAWQALVTPTTAESEVKGEVTIRATEGGETYSAISIEGGESGSTYPWHVHSGIADRVVGSSEMRAPTSPSPSTPAVKGRPLRRSRSSWIRTRSTT